MEAVNLTKLAIRAARKKQHIYAMEKEAAEQALAKAEQALEKSIGWPDETGAEAARLEAKAFEQVNAPPADGPMSPTG